MGIKRKYSEDERNAAVSAYNSGAMTAIQAARALRVSRPRFYQIVGEDGGNQTLASQLRAARALLTKLYWSMAPGVERSEVGDFLLK
jgi:hypothetical protein